VIGAIGDLDKQLGTQVTNAANLVHSGRNDLDSVKKWVHDAAATTQNNQAGERMKMTIVSKGLGQLTEVINNTDGQMQKVKGEIDKIKGEYEALGKGQKFAPKEKQGDADAMGDDGKSEAQGLPPEEQARRDVEATLRGEETSAGRVNDVLASIKPGQELSPLQDAYLTQMQSQQKGMSVGELSEAKDNLDIHKNVLGDSWQLMSNKDVEFSGSEDKPGSAAMLPDSVQQALRNADQTYPVTMETNALRHGDDLQAIADVVKDGNPQFQTGTELDRQMILASDKVMDAMQADPDLRGATHPVQSLFEAVDDDHQIVNDHVMGRNGTDADDFLHDVNTVEWSDDGKAAGHLFSWTNEHSTGPDKWIASETAERYATYIGTHKDDLMGINGQTLGEYNPELVKGYAHGLTPYISDIAGLSTDDKSNAFKMIDVESAEEQAAAKAIFSVLSTQEDAFKEFHSAVDAQIIAASHSWADDVKNNVQLQPNDERLLDAQTLRGLGAVGTHEAAVALGENATTMYEQQKSAYEQAVKLVSAGSNVIPGYGQFMAPGIDAFGSTMQGTILGEAPKTADYTIPPLSQAESARFALNALLAQGVPLADNTNGGFKSEDYFELVDPADPSAGYKPTILDTSGLARNDVSPNSAEQVLTQLLRDTLPGDNDPIAAMKDKYDDVVKNPDPNTASEPGT
jgi:hypothetical protein